MDTKSPSMNTSKTRLDHKLRAYNAVRKTNRSRLPSAAANHKNKMNTESSSVTITRARLDHKLRTYNMVRKTKKRRILFANISSRRKNARAPSIDANHHAQNLSHMPFDMLQHICSFLNDEDHTRGFAETCRFFYRVSREREAWCDVLHIAWEKVAREYPMYANMNNIAKRYVIDSPIFQLQLAKYVYNNSFNKRINFARTRLILTADTLPIQLHVMFLVLLDTRRCDDIQHLHLVSHKNHDDIYDDDFADYALIPLVQQITRLRNLRSLNLELKSGSHQVNLKLEELRKLTLLEELILGPHVFYDPVDDDKDDGVLDGRGEFLSWFPKLRRLEMSDTFLTRLLCPFAAPFSEQAKKCLITPILLESFTWKNLKIRSSFHMTNILERFKQQHTPIPLRRFCIEFNEEDDECLDMDPFINVLFQYASTMRIFELGLKSVGMLHYVPEDHVVSTICENTPAVILQLCMRQERARGMHRLKSHLTPYNSRSYHDDKPLRLEMLVISRVEFETDFVDTIIRILMAFPSLKHLVFVECVCVIYQVPKMMLPVKTPYSIAHPELDDDVVSDEEREINNNRERQGPNAPLSVTQITDEIDAIMEPAWANKIKFMSRTQFDVTKFN